MRRDVRAPSTPWEDTLMFRMKLVVLAVLVAGVLSVNAVARAEQPGTKPPVPPPPPPVPAPPVAQQPRQYYAKFWAKNKGYYFKQYYYKPTANAVTYRTQYVIYY